MKTRILVFVLIIGIGAVAVGWVYESQLRERVQTTDLVIPANIDYFLTDFNYRAMNTAGDLDYEFDSRRLEHYPRGDVSTIEAPSLNIYRADQQWRVVAGRGEFEHKHNLLRLQQSVVMQKSGNDPLRITSEEIRFEPDRDRVSSDSGVVMQSPGTHIEAESADFDLANNVYRLSRTRAIYRHGES